MIFYTEELLVIDFRDELKSVVQQINELYYFHAPDWQQAIFDQIISWHNNDEFQIPTSGTTDHQKTIHAKKEYLAASANATCDFFHLNPGSTLLLCMSPQYIGGRMMIARAIERQLKLFCVKTCANPLHDFDIQIDFTALVPLQVKAILDENPERLGNFKKILIGGAECDADLIQTLKEKKIHAYNSFGMTETFSHIAIKSLSPVEKDYYMILDHVDCTVNEEQRLVINSPSLGIDRLTTNDIVSLEGKKLKWICRSDDIINSGGIKINTIEIENKVREITQQPFIVNYMKDDKLGEQLVLVSDFKIDDPEKVLTLLKNNLPNYHNPKKYFYIPEIPYTETGKVKRKALHDLIEGLS